MLSIILQFGRFTMQRVIILSFLVALGYSAYTPDLVTSLPGYDGTLKYSQYSGYLNGSDDGNIQLHYWFVTSQNDPDTDPLVLWLNGGPGCSSMDGMLYEHGPLLVNEDGTNLTDNPWSWNKISNMIYLESPACVGFSYALDGNCQVDDDSAAEENFQALLSFLEKFPEYEGRDLYITGESYGGIYVPTLTYKIFTTGSPLQSMLKGFAVGNGLLSNSNNTNSLVTFGYSHGIVSSGDYEDLLKNCDCSASDLQCDFLASKKVSCISPLAYALQSIYSKNLNIYDVIDTCFYGTSAKKPLEGDKIKARLAKETLMAPFSNMGLHKLSRTLIESGVDVPCVDSVGATNWLNRDDVKTALHIKLGLPEWAICADLPYGRIYDDMVTQFTTLISGGVQGLVYNGDVDGACNFIGDEYFVKNLGYRATTLYKPWFTPDNQIGGWWKSFGDKFQFTTVRGAGHTVPEYKPMAAYIMWEAFLNNDYSN